MTSVNHDIIHKPNKINRCTKLKHKSVPVSKTVMPDANKAKEPTSLGLIQKSNLSTNLGEPQPVRRVSNLFFDGQRLWSAKSIIS